MTSPLENDDAVRGRRGLRPDPELWSALGEGALLTTILTDFYTRVYSDARLAPFFESVSIDRAIEKQWSFLCQIFTGEDVYFGDRPRNAHHWMVISDELMTYREELMASCLRRHGLAEPLVARFRAVEESFRKQIVKDRPRAKKLRGTTLPLDGYEPLELAVGSVCDGCQASVEAGASIRYHRRTGRIRCCDCEDEASPDVPG